MILLNTVIIRTFAYNAEKTIERTIKSILGQTYSNFVWYIINNGSTDHTGEIIKKYKEKDNRVKVIQIEQNRIDTDFTIGIFKDILKKYDDNCFFCTIDSDDCYSHDFLQTMLEFMSENRLDVAACGSYFINGSTNEISGMRSVPKDLIVTESNKAMLFPVYYQFARTIWGKLYSVRLLKNCDFSGIENISYGNDTFFTLVTFRNSRRIGIINRILHHYYMYPKSASYMPCDEKRIAAADILLDESRKYLLDFGELSQYNTNFLNAVYYNAIKDTIELELLSKDTPDKKILICKQIFQSKNSQKIFSNEYSDSIKELCEFIDKWLKSNSLDFSVKNRQEIQYILNILHPGVQIHECLFQTESLRFLFLMKCIETSEEVNEKEMYYEQINLILVKNIYTMQIPRNLWQKYQHLIRCILEAQYEKAIRNIKETSNKEKLPDGEMESLLKVGGYLAAGLEKEEVFIQFKKKLIDCLLKQQKMQDAKEELDDFDILLPNDKDFSMYRQIINSKENK